MDARNIHGGILKPQNKVQNQDVFNVCDDCMAVSTFLYKYYPSPIFIPIQYSFIFGLSSNMAWSECNLLIRDWIYSTIPYSQVSSFEGVLTLGVQPIKRAYKMRTFLISFKGRLG